MSYYDPDDYYPDPDGSDWWDEHGDEVDPVVDDEIDGEDVVSLEELQDEEYDSDDEDY